MSEATNTTAGEGANRNAAGGMVPHLVVSDGARAIAFYGEALGAEELGRVPAEDGRRLMHATLRVNGNLLYLCDDFPEYWGGQSRAPEALGGSPVTIHLPVPDCDAAVARAARAGATVIMEPVDAFWGDRYGKVKDPFGHEWSFSTPLKAPAGRA